MSSKEYTVKIRKHGTEWRLGGVLHREGGPAIYCDDGYEAWMQNGVTHREDGPAITLANGDRFWYQNGLEHRLDGPVAEYTRAVSGGISPDDLWFIEGKKYTKEAFDEEVARRNRPTCTCEGEIVELDGKRYKIVKL